MKLLLMLAIGLAVGGGIFYVMATKQQETMQDVQVQQDSAQEKADAYRTQQEKMMKEIQQ